MVSADDDQQLALEVELAQVESAMQVHAATLRQLDQKRWQIKRKMNTYCPILKLPPEISLRFFMTTFPRNSCSDWGRATPLLFGAICHEWRELAWSSPLLWSSVSFIVERYSKRKNNLLKEWLARSRSLPLFIHLRMFDPRNESNVLWKDTMDIIAHCSERWRIIDFHLFFMFHHEICFVPTQFPLLESMTMCMSSYDIYDDLMSELNAPWKVDWNAPKLQYVYIEPYMDGFITLPLDQIINFSWLSSSTSWTCLEILDNAPNLIKCRFEGIEGSSDIRLPRVTALQLTTLELGFECTSSEESCMPQFLDNLTTPALHELSISEHHSYDALFPSSVLISFLSRSSCHLLRLSLSNLALLPDQLANCFSATPLLTELRLEGIVIKRETFEDLSVDETLQNILLPNLECFVYKYGRNDPFGQRTLDYPGLISMTTSRLRFARFASASSQHVAKLKSIHIDFTDGHIKSFFDYEDIPGGSNSTKRQNDNALATEGGCGKLNWHLIARFNGLVVTEGMDVRISGNQIDLLNIQPNTFLQTWEELIPHDHLVISESESDC